MPELTVEQVARLVGGLLVGRTSAVVRRIAPLESAGPEDLSFVANRRYLAYLQGTRAAAVLVSEPLASEVPPGLTHIRVADAHAALSHVLPALTPDEVHGGGIHPTAIVAPGAELADEVSIGPYAVIGEGARVGANTYIGAHAVIGQRVRVGAHCLLHPHVTVYPGVQLGDRCIIHSGARLGADGFGFAYSDGAHRKIPQVGGCRIGDDVEIGANTTIDRGSLGDTLVGSGTKIDNLVHLGHNVQVGRDVIIVAQTGISGSTTIGDGAVLGGQVGIAGHLTVGAGARVGAQAGVIGDVAPGETVSGYPARPHQQAMRAYAALFRLPEYLRKLRSLEHAVFGRMGLQPAGGDPQQEERSENG